MLTLSRRSLVATAALVFTGAPALAHEPMGKTTSVAGTGTLVSDGKEAALQKGALLYEGNTVMSGKQSLVSLTLRTSTDIFLGQESRITIDKFLADIGGVISIGGAIVFDRPGTLPATDITIQTAFGEIGVRGTRFFAGPSKGAFAVFVQRGTVEVRGAGVTRTLNAGDGVDMTAGAAPSEVAKWKQPRIDAAFALVGLRP